MVHIFYWDQDKSTTAAEGQPVDVAIVMDHAGHLSLTLEEREDVRPGDICYLVRRCGRRHGSGIFMRGLICSDPYMATDEDTDESACFVDIYPQEYISTPPGRPLTEMELQQSFPAFDWMKGASGRCLPDEYAAPLADKWYRYLKFPHWELNETLWVNDNAWQLTPRTIDFWKWLNAKNGIVRTR